MIAKHQQVNKRHLSGNRNEVRTNISFAKINQTPKGLYMGRQNLNEDYVKKI